MKRAVVAVALVIGVVAAVGSVALSSRSGHIARSTSMPGAIAQKLRQTRIRFRLAPPDLKPPIDSGRALASLTADLAEEHARPRQLYLVLIKHNTRTWLAWMAVGHGVGPPEKCPPNTHGCPPRINGWAVALLNAKDGNGMMVTGLASASSQAELSAAQMQVVEYSGDDVRICPPYANGLVAGPPQIPPCSTGLRAVGVDTSALTTHIAGHPERWGLLHLAGVYTDGTFHVTAQGPSQVAPNPPSPFGAPVPCPAPGGGWRFAAPTESQNKALNHYSVLAHHHDLVSIAMWHHASILVVSSADPARTRTVLGKYWPRQLCVVKARYPRALVDRVRARLVSLITAPGSPSAAKYGWPTGGGGTGVDRRGQLTTQLDVLLVTPQLRALLRKQPRGVVQVQATLAPVSG